ncbi:MAG: DNA topoisomerase IB [Actinomycetota bacterium]
MPRLKRIDCSEPGIARRRNGRGFLYFTETGDRIRDPELLARLKGLVIPPAWTDVWICPYPNGHLQAVGVDAAGRRQYIYHERWRSRRDAEKFDRTLQFARALPQLRRTCDQHLAQEGLGRNRVLACAVRLLDHGFFRIGTESYAEENKTFGLATLKKRHVRIRDGVITFDYVSKGGKRRIQSMVNQEVLDVVAALKRRRGGGDKLLAYKERRIWMALVQLLHQIRQVPAPREPWRPTSGSSWL